MAAKECPNCRLLSPGTATFCSCGYDFEAGGMRAPRVTQRPRPTAPPPDAPLNPYAPGAATSRTDRVSLPLRIFGMPFVPTLWSRAAGWPFMQVVVPVALLAILLDTGLAVYRGWGLRAGLRGMARTYSESYPAILVAGGKVSVEGDRVVQFVEGNTTILVDPKETIPLEQIATSEYVVVREDEVIRRQGLRTEITKVSDLQSVFGDPIRIDAASIRAFDERWGGAIQVGAWAFILAFALIADVLAVVYVVAAAGLALLVRGRAAGRTYGQCLRTALAVYSLVIVVDLALNLIGKSPGFCVGLWLWPLVLTGLSAWAVGRSDG